MSGATTGLPAWVDGRLHSGARAATVDALDAGLRSGWGVFETLRARGTTVRALEQHLARLADGAGRLGIAIDVGSVRDALTATLAAPRAVEDVVARVTLTAGPVAEDRWPAGPIGRPALIVTLHPAPPLPTPSATAVRVTAHRWPADVKTTSYVASMLAGREAQAAGADVAVLVDGDELLETSDGNLLALVAGTLRTPAPDGRLLPGVTRGLVLAAATDLGIPVVEGPLRAADVHAAEVVLVTSTVRGVRTLHRLDGRPLAGADVDAAPPHPLVPTLRAAVDRGAVGPEAVSPG
jgi:branched-chain amino acid aminotransferase